MASYTGAIEALAAESVPSPPATPSFWSSFKSAKVSVSSDRPGVSKSKKVVRKYQAYRKSISFSDNQTSNAVTVPEHKTFQPQTGAPASPRPDSTPIRVSQIAGTSPRDSSSTRPRHIPIVIPDYTLFGRQSPSTNTRNDSFSTDYNDKSSPTRLNRDTSSPDLQEPRRESAQSRPRHVEIKIPDWAEPILWKQPSTQSPPILSDPFPDAVIRSPSEFPQPAFDVYSTMAMDPYQTDSAPTQNANNPSRGGNSALPPSAHSSQTSLVGMRSDYESASEAESSQNEDQPRTHASNQANTRPSPANTQTPSGSTPGVPSATSNLSGLVCNVHRTTGREPLPLVGATTTILGDKLYVLGGRRLSRSKPQLTSHLYALDLIHRHWTRLEPKGDVPAPRYFHSVCALGDTKLVCYGGMSPAVNPERPTNDQSEVVVMSDIHVYDVPSNTWMKLTSTDAPQGRYAHCTSILPSGSTFGSPNAPLSAVHHNPSGQHPNQGTLGVSLDGAGGAEMVVVGGQDSANHYIEQISVFNLRSLKWTGTTGMGRSCGAYRSVVSPLTTMTADQIGAGPHAMDEVDDDEDEEAEGGEEGRSRDASRCPMLIYSNYNFLDVKLELQIRLTDGTLTEKPMRTEVSPPGLRFPNGGIIDKHFVVSGTFLTSAKQEYALWALDLRTLTWSRIDASSNIFSQGSWNRGTLWSRRNAFVILGNRRRNLVDDYNNRRINFTNICIVELEAFGLYDNPRIAEPNSGFVSASANIPQMPNELAISGRHLSDAASSLGAMSLGVRELADMGFLAIDGTKIPVNSRLVARRWGQYFTQLMRESHVSANDTDTLRPSVASHPSRNSSITITPSVTSTSSTVTNNGVTEVPDVRSLPPPARSRLLYLPHTTPTLHALLHYLYTSYLPAPPSPLATPQILCSLLQLARPYKIDGLLEAVVERLHESLDGRNAAAIFNAAAMGAGGGDGVQFAPPPPATRPRESIIPPRTASLANLDGVANGVSRTAASLRVDTDVANGGTARNTLRAGQSSHPDGPSEDDMPLSARTDNSMSGSDASLSSRGLTSGAAGPKVEWNGALSAVVGLQKRGLRGLMEGRRMRERGRSDAGEAARVGLGIAAA